MYQYVNLCKLLFCALMNSMREINLINGINVCIKRNENTPRVALSLNFSIVKPELKAGQYLLMNRLLMKGTQRYSSEELSTVLDENAIELYTEMKYDYLRFRFVALNEDFEFALSILADIVLNSTFEEFEKEKEKLKGEMLAELDSAKVKVSDLFTKTIYKNHFYGHSYTEILEEILVHLRSMRDNWKEVMKKVNSDVQEKQIYDKGKAKVAREKIREARQMEETIRNVQARNERSMMAAQRYKAQ